VGLRLINTKWFII